MVDGTGSIEPSRTSRASRAASENPVIRQVQERLRCSPFSELHSVRVQEQAGVLRLEGRVTSFYIKQAAQVTIGREYRSGRIENAIEVA